MANSVPALNGTASQAAFAVCLLLRCRRQRHCTRCRRRRQSLTPSEGSDPVPSDYDGSGTTDLAVWRHQPAHGTSADGSGIVYRVSTEKPVPADHAGHGLTASPPNTHPPHKGYVQGAAPLVYGHGRERTT